MKSPPERVKVIIPNKTEYVQHSTMVSIDSHLTFVHRNRVVHFLRTRNKISFFHDIVFHSKLLAANFRYHGDFPKAAVVPNLLRQMFRS